MTDRDDVRRLMGQLGTPVEAYQVFNDPQQAACVSRWALLESVSKTSRTGRASVNESRAEDIGPRMSQLVAHLVRSSDSEKEEAIEKDQSLNVEASAVLPTKKGEPSQTDTGDPVRSEPRAFSTLFQRTQPAADTAGTPSPVATGESLKHLLKKIGA